MTDDKEKWSLVFQNLGSYNVDILVDNIEMLKCKLFYYCFVFELPTSHPYAEVDILVPFNGKIKYLKRA
ncbi:hypothetical protein BDFG_03564 [Blastomyces dermatitidis ATCC 26199]|nr:hypothetical protein BDFG_03564 [Blastomyces dermatitidis ATCC 26199]